MSELSNPRTDKTCNGAVALPISESFRESTTVVMFSPPFHAAIGRTISIQLTAEMFDPSANPALGTVGVNVNQCCDVLDSKVSDQVVGAIGPNGSPQTTTTSVTLTDECTLSTHVNGDCVYYLRLKIASSLEQVLLSYSIS
ncbi:hypothetical protein ACIRRH_43155 [Kitasatospora sp. NPDC101235]|uniref:hypothetical protein n=1 Tax=Kitasatospora sp. NPDC101235 TaxID=3364101 RepID=UPI00381641B9